MAIRTAAELDRVGTGHAVVRLAHGSSHRRRLGVAGRPDVDRTAAAGIAGIGFLVETDPLPRPELVETLIFDVRAVEEEVVVPAAIAGDEAEAFVADGLDRAGGHELLLSVGRPRRTTGDVMRSRDYPAAWGCGEAIDGA